MKSKEISNLIKNYKWKSMFFKYCKTTFTFFSIPILIIIILIFLFNSSKEDAGIKLTATQSFVKTAGTIEKILSETDRYAVSLSSNENVIKIMDIPNYDDNISLATYHFDEVKKLFGIIQTNTQYIKKLYAYSFKNKYVFGGTYFDEFIYKDIIYKGIKEPQIPKLFFDEKSSSLVKTYPVYKNDFLAPSGFICFIINRQDINNYIYGNFKPNEEIYLYSSDKNIIFKTVNDTPILPESLFIKNSDYTFLRQKDYTYCSLYMPSYDCYLVSKVHDFKTAETQKKTFLFFLLIIFICVIFSVLLSFFVSLKIYSSIADTVVNLGIPKELKEQNSNPEFNEFWSINNSIIEVMKKNASIETQLAEKIKQLKSAQSVALQAQISPHFIFNTLNLVNAFILKVTKKDNDATKLVSLLSEVMYNTLSNKEYIIPLRAEIENLEKFIQIELIKSFNGFSVVWDIPDEIMDYNIVSLSLQPIVENAIWHSFKKDPSYHGTLEISGKIIENDLTIRISNDGIPISPADLPEIRSKINQENFPTPPHVGLCNVHKRIQLICGNEYGINIDVISGKTVVTVTFPKSIAN